MIQTDLEFQNLIPSLTEEEFSQLRENILSEGVRDPLVLWKNTLVDGHNRYVICKENDIHFNIVERDFDNREEAKVWIIQNQFGRRNLNNYQRSILALNLEHIFSKRAKEKQAEAGGAVPQKSAKPVVDTRHEVAKTAKVSHDTISKVKAIQEKATDEQKEKLENGEESINGIFTQLEGIPKKKPHVAHNSGENEWYTPDKYIESVRIVLGKIDLDPASSKEANGIVKANKYFTLQTDGLTKGWFGKVWMNPPYSSELISLFTDKFTQHFNNQDISEGIVLVNNATETIWFQLMAKLASSICFPKTRIKYWAPNKDISTPLQGQAFLYFGDNTNFENEFKKYGFCCAL